MSAPHHYDPEHVLAGHKANIHNPNTSEESKIHSREVLKEMHAEVPEPLHDEHKAHVAGGLKSAIHNPNVSAEAKEHAKEKLEEMN